MKTKHITKILGCILAVAICFAFASCGKQAALEEDSSFEDESFVSEDTNNQNTRNNGAVQLNNEGKIATFSVRLNSFCKEYNNIYNSNTKENEFLLSEIGGGYTLSSDEFDIQNSLGTQFMYNRLSDDVTLGYVVDLRTHETEDDSSSCLLKSLFIFYNRDIEKENVKKLFGTTISLLIPQFSDTDISKISNKVLTEEYNSEEYTEEYNEDCIMIKGGCYSDKYNYLTISASIPQEVIEKCEAVAKRDATEEEIETALDVIAEAEFYSDFGKYNLYAAINSILSAPSINGTVDGYGNVTLTFSGTYMGYISASTVYEVDPIGKAYLFSGSNLQWESLLKSYPA